MSEPVELETLNQEAAEIAEQITAGWWDAPAIETREECVANLTQLVSAVLARSESFSLLSAQAKASYEAGRFSRAEELSSLSGRVAMQESTVKSLRAEIERMVRKLSEGTLHDLICNGDHRKRVGSPDMICNCTLGVEIKRLRFQLAASQQALQAEQAMSDKLVQEFQQFIDDMTESEGRYPESAHDRADAVLAGYASTRKTE